MHLINRFFMKHYPNYFQMNESEKEAFKINNEDELLENFEAFFFQEKYQKDITKTPISDILEDEEILFDFNKHTIFLRGIGKNHFFLNESLEKGDMLKFQTLYDYDYDNFKFQEKATYDWTKEENDRKGIDTPEFILPEYRIRTYANWARCIWNENNQDNFYYLILNSLASHIYMEVEEKAFELIDSLIPNNYYEGKNHGKKTKNGSIFNLEVNANGMERQLDELKDRTYKFLKNIFDESKKEIDNKKYNCVWVKTNTDVDIDPTKHIIFSDTEVIKNIRFRNFQEDVEKRINNSEDIINTELNYYLEKTNSFINEQYKDIIDNFDPKLYKFKKKTKIVISDDFEGPDIF